MGAVTEGMMIPDIQQKFGKVEGLLPYRKKAGTVRWHNSTQVFQYKEHERPAGCTEDGIERQKMICNAIIENRRPVTADEVAAIWVRDMKPENFGYLIEPCDDIPYYLAKAGMYPGAIGQLNEWPGIISITRSIHPVGLINACNPRQAAVNAQDIARLYQPIQGVGLSYTAGYAAAIAEGCRPGATMESMLAAAFEYGGRCVREDVTKALDVAAKYDDPFEALQPLNDLYHTDGIYMSYSEELVPRAFAIFFLVKGDPKQACIVGTNSGRDTDCVTALAAGLAGALNGSSSIPQEWIDQVDEATRTVPWSVCGKSIEEVSKGIYQALEHHVATMKTQIQEIELQK